MCEYVVRAKRGPFKRGIRSLVSVSRHEIVDSAHAQILHPTATIYYYFAPGGLKNTIMIRVKYTSFESKSRI